MKQKIIFLVSLLFGLLFINGGLDKFFHYMPQPTDMPEKLTTVFNAFMTIEWLLPLVGVVEVIAGVLFVFPQTRALGAVMIFPVMVGILLTNTLTEPSGMPLAIILMAINLWIIYENREKYRPMVS